MLFVDFQQKDRLSVKSAGSTVVLAIVRQDLLKVKPQERSPFDGWHELHQLPHVCMSLHVRVALMWQAYAASLTCPGDTEE